MIPAPVVKFNASLGDKCLTVLTQKISQESNKENSFQGKYLSDSQEQQEHLAG